MSDHLSECLWDDYWAECICPDLRVYGERMRAACITAVDDLSHADPCDCEWCKALAQAMNTIGEVQP